MAFPQSPIQRELDSASRDPLSLHFPHPSDLFTFPSRIAAAFASKNQSRMQPYSGGRSTLQARVDCTHRWQIAAFSLGL